MAGTITRTSAACHIPTIWASDTLDAVRANIILAGLVNRQWEKYLKVGDTLNIPRTSNPTAQTKTANTNVSLEVLGPSGAETAQQITVTTHQYVAFGVENIVEVQAITNLRSVYTDAGGYALAAGIDTNLFTLPQSFTPNIVGTLGVELTDDNLLRAWQYLEDNNVPSKDRFIVLTPAAYAGVLKLDKFMNRDYTGEGGEGVRDAYVGQIYGAPTYKTTLVRNPAAGQGECIFSQKQGMALIVQETTSRAAYVIERDADVVLLTQIYGYSRVLYPPITAGGGAAIDSMNVLMRTVA